jgi:hypothetical protein
MAVVCKCGQVADEQDRECFLCGRELPSRGSDSAGFGETGRQGDQETSPSPGGAPAYPAPEERRPRRTRSLIPALLGGTVALLLVAGILLVLDRRPVNVGSPTVPAAPPTPTVEQTTVGDSEPTSSIAEPTLSPTVPAPPSDTVEPWSPLDPPAPADEQGDDTTVVSDAAAAPCRESSRTVYGGYPAASCDLWKTPVGLLHEEPITKGSRRVACQRDLDVDNPVYTPKQTNTWWIWTTSETGTWDWYPETAIEQGASDQPVNGVALCHR